MMKACDPADKAFEHEDVVEEMHLGKPGLHGKNVEDPCAKKTSVASIETAEDLIDCVVEATQKDSHEAVKTSTPKASKHLKEASEKMDALPEDPADPTAKADAKKAADDARHTIDPNDDGVPDEAAAFNPAARVVFVSSGSYTGNFSGATGANEECDRMAFAAGLPGQFMAWISDGSVLAPDVLSDLTAKPFIPYATLDGTIVAADRFTFANGGLLAPINVDENGAVVADAPVWTSTDAVGDNKIDDCTGYNDASPGNDGHVGRTSRSDGGWTDDSTLACDQLARILLHRSRPPSVTPRFRRASRTGSSSGA